jgi:hypothetical protein
MCTLRAVLVDARHLGPPVKEWWRGQTANSPVPTRNRVPRSGSSFLVQAAFFVKATGLGGTHRLFTFKSSADRFCVSNREDEGTELAEGALRTMRPAAHV